MTVDPDSFPPTISTREDCGKPTGCVCQADEACQFPKLQAQIPAAREDVEMPEQGQ
jgi:hypothetical protein